MKSLRRGRCRRRAALVAWRHAFNRRGADDPGCAGAQQIFRRVWRRPDVLPAICRCANRAGGGRGQQPGGRRGDPKHSVGRGARRGDRRRSRRSDRRGIRGGLRRPCRRQRLGFAQMSAQQQFDIMYGQCMAAHGNQVAGFSPPPDAPRYPGGSAPGPRPYPRPAIPEGPLPYPARRVPGDLVTARPAIQAAQVARRLRVTISRRLGQCCGAAKSSAAKWRDLRHPQRTGGDRLRDRRAARSGSTRGNRS